MTVRKVKDAISHVRSVVKEWQEIGATWEEEHTRYALIDPIVRALDWDTSDPKQCHPEFPRGKTERMRVDYVLFADATPQEIYDLELMPDIIVEAKAYRNNLDEWVTKLEEYIEYSPPMTEGFGVLTNGADWWLYDLTLRGILSSKRHEKIGLLSMPIGEATEILDKYLSRGAALKAH